MLSQIVQASQRAVFMAVLGLSSLSPLHYAFGFEPGEGITVYPGQDNIDGENFQTIIVMKALEKLGYTVKPVKNAKYSALHVAVADGDLTFIADHWDLLQQDFYEKSGGETKLSRQGGLIPNCAQGYLIDKKTAEKYNITNIDQLRDPKIAKLFDANNDGKADLGGCIPGWGCERVIEYQLDAYDLRKTVTHNQGQYAAIMADTISRFREGRPVLYYTWAPLWVNSVMVPNRDVVWLQVPKSAHPDGYDTQLPNGKNYGFPVNTQQILANRDFIEKNPAAAKLFELITISPNDISAQNKLMMEHGQSGWKAAEQHAENWIKHNQFVFNSWIAKARLAGEVKVTQRVQ